LTDADEHDEVIVDVHSAEQDVDDSDAAMRALSPLASPRFGGGGGGGGGSGGGPWAGVVLALVLLVCGCGGAETGEAQLPIAVVLGCVSKMRASARDAGGIGGGMRIMLAGIAVRAVDAGGGGGGGGSPDPVDVPDPPREMVTSRIGVCGE
jgi:hypothetical protein